MIHCAQGFAAIPNEVLRDPTLSPAVKVLYCVGATYLQGGAGTIFPSYRKLAELCGFCRRTAIRAAQELERRGLWRVERRRDEQTMVCQTNLVSYAAPGDSRVTTPGDSRVTTPVTQSHPCIKNQPYQDPGVSTRAGARAATPWEGLQEYLGTGAARRRGKGRGGAKPPDVREILRAACGLTGPPPSITIREVRDGW